MSWMVLHVLGIMAYATTGAFIALEAGYSFAGVFVLGLTTSFGGAVVRNLIIGAPVSAVWDPSAITIVLVTLTLIILLPQRWTYHWKKWGVIFDSIGLASFALQGALSAYHTYDQLGVILISGMFTGLGGGMIRDLLAGRKPLALKEEIHAVLTLLCGLCVWLDWTNSMQFTVVVVVVTVLRILAIRYQWRINVPRR
ncbi:trimeric intracellular cation channel family protein [Paenibacillus cremeus]|uniref:Trimeric intracellular cation channel family protein n=1 Tax=Paenibacillus cremeus TaxID=2163881 RepID=A0A559KDS7_9BACL|nr:TRIC cation channel family protein [Paenibacillus cremeus]TVY10287.1 trimeric intracellular cation channel family protein [Paenibacillus cremeus]